jgi:hypothetical protein
VAHEEISEPLIKTPGVRKQIPHRDRLYKRGRDLEIEVIVDVPIQINLTGLNQLHYGNPGKKLRD